MSNEITEKIAKVLETWSNGRLELARVNLEKNGIKRTSMLSQSLKDNGIEVIGKDFRIQIIAEEYYDYINQGVKGLKNERLNSGIYKFKTRFPSKAMIDNISDWIPRKGVKIFNKEKITTAKTKAETEYSRGGFMVNQLRITKNKTKTQQELNNEASIGIAYAIKQKGIKQTNFWSDTFNPITFRELAKEIEVALGEKYKIDLTFSKTKD